MAREIANIRLEMWGDREWRSLTQPAQHLYLYLLSSPSLDYAGVADWRPNRIAALTEGVTPADVIAAGAELQAKAFVYVDDVTEEVFIRSFVKHDGLLKHPRIPVAMAKDFADISSADIQDYFIHELVKESKRDPDLKCWANPKVSALLDRPSRDLKADSTCDPSPDPSPDPSGDATVHPFVSPSLIQTSACSTATATTTATSPTGDGGTSRPGRKRPPTPIPDGWTPTPAHASKASELRVDLNVEADRFRNWHLSKDSRFANWNAAFSNWLTKAGEFAAEKKQASGSSSWEMEGEF